jgi:2-polyprenyl-3-methyl-5-hydroxy-6-metoxy-1,4-benzoquinol methylase
MQLSTMSSPDAHGANLLSGPLDPLRYETLSDDPLEAAGILHTYMPSNVKVLDVGCGTGSVSLIANQGKNNVVVGVEPDSVRAGVAQSRGILATCGYLTPEYIAEKGPFDVVMFADVLEHLANPSEMLELAHSALQPGGVLLISVPNAAHWTMRWDLLFGHFDYTPSGIKDSTHLRWFTEATIVHLVTASGFRVAEIRQSAGTALSEYFTRAPWAWMKFTHRNRLIRLLAKAFPRLFGCQHLIKAHRE